MNTFKTKLIFTELIEIIIYGKKVSPRSTGLIYPAELAGAPLGGPQKRSSAVTSSAKNIYIVNKVKRLSGIKLMDRTITVKK